MHAPSTVDRPFAPPIDIELDLPPPPSVNHIWQRAKSGKRHVFSSDYYKKWKRAADDLIGSMAQLRGVKPLVGPFEAILVVDPKQCRADPDNCWKGVLDYIKNAGLIVDDSFKYARKLTVEAGYAPHGCKLILRAREP